MTNEQILLIGAGPMAVEYAKVLKALNKNFIVFGRGENSAREFEKTTGIKVITGGVDKLLNQNKGIPKTAIIAVSEEQLGKVALRLITKGTKSILVEKPGGLDFDEIKKVKEAAVKNKAKVFVGYNRRFYSSVQKAREIIKEDGRILSIFFDFTELGYKISPLVKAAGVKENWFLQNSTHIVDLVFFLVGAPRKICAFTSGSLPWHPKAAIFSGAGITKKGILFAYHANWEGPGRWNLEIVTKKHKLFFKPLEKLQIQDIASLEIKGVEFDEKLDINFKPGIYKQVQSFLGNKQYLCTISEQVNNLKIYKEILKNQNVN